MRSTTRRRLLVVALYGAALLFARGHDVRAGFSAGNAVTVSVQTVSGNLSGNVGGTVQLFPTDVATFPDGTERHAIATLGGVIRLADSTDVVLASPYLDTTGPNTLTSNATDPPPGFDFGLTTIAFDPDFAAAGTYGYGRFYTVESEKTQPAPDFPGAAANQDIDGNGDPTGDNPAHDRVLYEYVVDNPAHSTLTLGVNVTRRRVLTIHEHRRGHDVNDLLFDPQGYLLIAVGDTVTPGTAQNLGLVFGKILKIDPRDPLDPLAGNPLDPLDRLSDNGRYRVPGSNPFFDGNNSDGSLDEIWALGLRNPWRLEWDAAGNRALIVNVGQDSRETIVAATGGENFGWPDWEGTLQIDGGTALPAPVPLFEYSHDGPAQGAAAITGLVAYTSGTIAELTGRVIFGDLAAGILFYGDAASGDFHPINPSPGVGFSSINSGAAGRIFVLGFDGTVLVLLPNGVAVPAMGPLGFWVLVGAFVVLISLWSWCRSPRPTGA